jgi:hypothetical protein
MTIPTTKKQIQTNVSPPASPAPAPSETKIQTDNESTPALVVPDIIDVAPGDNDGDVASNDANALPSENPISTAVLIYSIFGGFLFVIAVVALTKIYRRQREKAVAFHEAFFSVNSVAEGLVPASERAAKKAQLDGRHTKPFDDWMFADVPTLERHLNSPTLMTRMSGNPAPGSSQRSQENLENAVTATSSRSRISRSSASTLSVERTSNHSGLHFDCLDSTR